MEYIEFLGVSGTKTISQGTTCIRVSKSCVIDAGNLIRGLGNSIYDIEHIFLTHSHLDHIVDIAFVADLFVAKSEKPLKIYGLKSTLDDLRELVFNHRIWPDFAQINLAKNSHKTIEFIELEADIAFEIDGITLTPFKTNHTSGSCGYMIERDRYGFIFTSDTYLTPRICEIIDENPHIHSLVIDISFPSRFEQLSYDSKHLTPKLLQELLSKCKRKDFKIYAMHLKPQYRSSISKELNELNIFSRGGHILNELEKLPFNPKNKIDNTFLNKAQNAISQIISIGIALSAEKNIYRLLELIITQSKLLTNADGGTLYLYNRKSEQLEFQIVQNDTLNIDNREIKWKPLELYSSDGSENRNMVAVTCALDQSSINIANIYESKQYDFSGTMAFDANTGYKSISMLVIPLKDHEDNLLGVLQLINKKEVDDTVIAFDHIDEEIVASLGSQAAVALTKQKLIDELELLLESFLNTINVAIEEKSLYTAGHINKMVELSLMIAKAISDDYVYFPHICFSNDELKEIKFAALMHDIGKITTPEHIMDKATKLETIYDRVETIECRFEIAMNQLEIKYLKNEISKEHYESELSQLKSDIEFIKSINIGSEFTKDEDIQRVKIISAREIILNNSSTKILTDDEIENLAVSRGTLTNEQRDIINNHATVSLKMLNQLPFPEKFKNVASIAAAHHEKINGKGYPQGLKGDELSFEARILAIADIFEALSASDRPYKKAKKLSEIMKILYFMAKDEDIDIKIVEFFYKSGLYLEYARKHLDSSLIDDVLLDF